MADRYFVDKPLPETPAGQSVTLAGSEAHHLIHVMRATPGDRVVLFDGSGAEFPAEIVRIARAEVELKITAREEIDRELPLEITLAVALPKGDRQRWLVEKATELGVRRVVPLRTTRSVAQPGKRAIERLRRTVIEASKQCGRNRLMEIVPPQDWPEFVAETSDVPCRLLAHPCGDAGLCLKMYDGPPSPSKGSGTATGSEAHRTGSEAKRKSVASYLADSPKHILLAVGPEGGLTDDEVALATAASWKLVDLGKRTLRIETAAICLAQSVVVLNLWGR